MKQCNSNLARGRVPILYRVSVSSPLATRTRHDLEHKILQYSTWRADLGRRDLGSTDSTTARTSQWAVNRQLQRQWRHKAISIASGIVLKAGTNRLTSSMIAPSASVADAAASGQHPHSQRFACCDGIPDGFPWKLQPSRRLPYVRRFLAAIGRGLAQGSKTPTWDSTPQLVFFCFVTRERAALGIEAETDAGLASARNKRPNRLHTLFPLRPPACPLPITPEPLPWAPTTRRQGDGRTISFPPESVRWFSPDPSLPVSRRSKCASYPIIQEPGSRGPRSREDQAPMAGFWTPTLSIVPMRPWRRSSRGRRHDWDGSFGIQRGEEDALRHFARLLPELWFACQGCECTVTRRISWPRLVDGRAESEPPLGRSRERGRLGRAVPTPPPDR